MDVVLYFPKEKHSISELLESNLKSHASEFKAIGSFPLCI